MPDKPKNEYKKLSSGRYMFRTVSLWVGKDHLLQREFTGYTEDYKRFYLRDIQAFLIRPNNQRAVWGIVWGACIALVLVLMGSLHAAQNKFLWGCGGLSFLLFSINFALGRGCFCHIKTAVQTIPLPISRLRNANRIIKKLKPLIEGAQTLLPEGPAIVPTQPLPSQSKNPEKPGHQGMKREFHPGVHWMLFVALILNSFIDISRYYILDLTIYTIGVFLSFGLIFLLVFALIRQSNSNVSTMIRKLTVGVLIFVIADYFLGSIWDISLSLKHPSLLRDEWAMLKLAASISPDDSVYSLFVEGFDLVGTLLLGLLGVAELIIYHQRSSTPSHRNPGPP